MKITSAYFDPDEESLETSEATLLDDRDETLDTVTALMPWRPRVELEIPSDSFFVL